MHTPWHSWHCTCQPSNRVRKTPSARRHCRPESFCASGKFLRVSTKLVRNQVKTSFWTVWKISRQSGNMTNNMESFQTVWKLSGNSKKFSVSLESFWTIRKIFGQSGEFPDSLKGFRTVWKYAGHSGKFPDGLLSFRRIWKVVGRSGRFPTNLESFWTVRKLSAWKVSVQSGSLQPIWKVSGQSWTPEVC